MVNITDHTECGLMKKDQVLLWHVLLGKSSTKFTDFLTNVSDLQAKSIGLISEPEVQHLEVKPGDRFIIIASDGVWDVMSSAEVTGFII